jgi:SpoVK/Ycf46/Vps4 family AAA+-type ATPase
MIFVGQVIGMSYRGSYVTASILAVESPSEVEEENLKERGNGAGGEEENVKERQLSVKPLESVTGFVAAIPLYQINRSTRIFWHMDDRIQPYLSTAALKQSLKSFYYGMETQIDYCIEKLDALPHNFMAMQGILLHGPKGSGKSSLIKGFLHARLHLYSYKICHPDELLGTLSFEECANLFENLLACKSHKYILVIEAIESLFSNENPSCGRLFMSLFSRMIFRKFQHRILLSKDGFLGKNEFEKFTGLIAIIGISSCLQRIPDVVLQPDYFEQEIEFKLPNFATRKLILEKLVEHTNFSTRFPVTDKMAHKTHGFTAANLKLLLDYCVAQHLVTAPLDILEQSMGKLTINRLDADHLQSKHHVEHLFLHNMPLIPIAAQNEWSIQAPHVKWHHIGGQAEAKQQLIESIEWPLKVSAIQPS